MNFGDIVFSGVLSEESVKTYRSEMFIRELSENYTDKIKNGISDRPFFTRFFVYVFDGDS